MPLLSNREACDVADAFLYTLYGDETFYRWKEVKETMKFEAERDYVNWLLDIVKHYDLKNINSKQDNDAEFSKSLGGKSNCRKHNTKRQQDLSGDIVDGEWNVPAGLGKVTNGAEDGRKGGGNESGDDNWGDNDNIDNDYEECPAQPYMPSDIKAPDDIGNIESSTPSTAVINDASGPVTGQNLTHSILSAQQILGMNLKSDGQSHFQRKFPCNMCKYVAKRQCHLKNHRLTMHAKHKPYPCPKCKFCASRADNLKQHMVNKHQAPSKFTCSKCNRPFAARSLLESHEKRCKGPVDPEEKKFMCNHCAFRTAYKNSLQNHIKTTHENVEYHACPHCEYVTNRKSNFKQHLICKHKYESAHKCERCTRQFPCAAKLKEHKEKCGTTQVRMQQHLTAEYPGGGNWQIPIAPATTNPAVFYG